MLVKTYKLALVAYGYLVFSVDINTKAGQVAFNPVGECIMTANQDEDFMLAWTRLILKYEQRKALSYIQFKQDFENSKLGDDSEDSDEWIVLLESYNLK